MAEERDIDDLSDQITLLTSCEVRVAKSIARERQAFDTANGFTERIQTKKESPLEIGQRGMLGEFAFCKMVDIWPDLGWEEAHPYDAFLFGKKVDVKCATRPELNIAAHHADRDLDPNHVFVGMYQLDEATYRFLGWGYADVLLKGKPNAEGPSGPYYKFEPGHLNNNLWDW